MYPLTPTGELEEIEQLTESVLILLRDIDHQVGHLTVRMGKNRAVHGTLVDKVHTLCQPDSSDHQGLPALCSMVMLALGSLDIYNSLKHDTRAVLDKLTHGMKICGQIYGCRENTLLVFTLGLAVQLFPPLGNIMHARLIVCQNLNGFSFAVKDVTDCCVEDCVVLLEGSVQCSLSSCCCAFHQFGRYQRR